MRKYVVELIGAFFLVLTVGMTAVYAPGAGMLAPVAIGLVLAVMVYMGGAVSGGHYNPSVTLGAWLRGACPAADVGPYIVAQLVGAVLAFGVARYLAGGQEVELLVPFRTPALVAEFLFTFALVFVVLSTATNRSTAGNSFYGLSIGGTVLVGAYAVGGISGGAFNPAVTLGLILMGKIPLASVWIYLVAQLLAAVVAALLYKMVIAED